MTLSGVQSGAEQVADFDEYLISRHQAGCCHALYGMVGEANVLELIRISDIDRCARIYRVTEEKVEADMLGTFEIDQRGVRQYSVVVDDRPQGEPVRELIAYFLSAEDDC